jgi:hypothetical protein
MRELGELVPSRLTAPQVLDLPPVRDEPVGDKSPMAAPPQCLRTHDCRGSLARKCLQSLDASGELGRGHVIGIAAEAALSPGAVWRVRLRLAAATELGKVDVLDPGRGQPSLELRAVELWVPS